MIYFTVNKRKDFCMQSRLVVHRMFLMFFHLVIPRKCLITWKRKEMQASSRASRDWCSLAGTIISTGRPRKKRTTAWASAWIWLVNFLGLSVLDLNAFERQNKAEGLGMVTEEGSSKSRGIFTDVRVSKQRVFPFQFRLKLSWSLL